MSELNFEILEELGKLTNKIRKEVSKIPKVGTNITEIINFVEKTIFENDCLPAFPCTVCINEIAAHYTVFDEGHILKKGDVIKIDFGISKDGYITDNAFTLEIGSNNHEKLLSANLEGLNAIMDEIEVGTTLDKIGDLVDKVAIKHGFNTIHNLAGHEIGRFSLHHGLSIPNYSNGDKSVIPDNSSFAIEPFFTYGDPKVKSCGNSNILHLVNSKPIRDPIAKKVLDFIKLNYPKLPFSKRWLVKDLVTQVKSNTNEGFDKNRVQYALNILKNNNIIIEYDALSTVDNNIVSQFEDMVVFNCGKKNIVTRIK